MITKRAGFKPRAINSHNQFVHRETFDYTYQFRPFNLYIITDDSGKYAITGENESDAVFMSTPNKKNRLQWVLCDTDTGCIAFFSDTKSYMNIDLIDGVIKVKRSDLMKEGLFKFNADRTMTMMSNPKFQLAFKLPTAEKKEEAAKPADAKAGDKKEGFGSLLWRRFKEGFKEAYDPLSEPVLEAVYVDTITKNPGMYSNTWKFEQVLDLRDAVHSMDTVEEMQKMDKNSDTRFASLQQMIANEKELAKAEIEYRDAKIGAYEKHWFISTFL